MIAVSCIVVTFLLLVHGQMGNSHLILPRTIDSRKIGSQGISIHQSTDNIEMDQGSGMGEAMFECRGETQTFNIPVLVPSDCSTFQTTGFNANGYPNSTDPDDFYFCTYVFEFGTTVDGTVTVKQEGFQFQEPDSTRCIDAVVISPVNDVQQEVNNSDLDDKDFNDDRVVYCGTITGDKIRDFSGPELEITFGGDDTENGNGAEIVICFA